MLFRRIEGAEPAVTGHVRIEPRLVVRDSTRVRTAAARPPAAAKARS